MTSLRQRVQIARRFRRSINIRSDIGDAAALEGFICPRSSQLVLSQMAQVIQKSRHAAFTWTGPYGSGKSSLAVALSAALSGNEASRQQNAEYVGFDTSRELWDALPPSSKGWKVIPVVGRRESPIFVIGDAVSTSQYSKATPAKWTSASLLSALDLIASQHPRSSGGLILFIDEMGKFLEAAAQDGHDVYFFQELAEAASRSNGRLIVIGVLHQAFEDYANRLSRELRDEWSKIQGRYVDLVIDSSGLEQIELISRAIDSSAPPPTNFASMRVAKHVAGNTGWDTNSLATLFGSCWPLHPSVACLLGPISRRRFGQNQRSIFGFLNSAEHHAFQEFLDKSTDQDLYFPEDLWNYLRSNLEPSILSSPDGHRWSMAVEALERCEGLCEDDFTINALKAISIIDLFKERSGLRANSGLVEVSVRGANKRKVRKALCFLQGQSLVIYRKFQDAFGIYAGSDFDIDSEVERVRPSLKDLRFDDLYRISGIQPLLAKRHYHKTGALRWFDVRFCSVAEALNEVQSLQNASAATGHLILAIPTNGESTLDSHEACRLAARESSEANAFVGVPRNGHEVGSLAMDLTALDFVRRNSPELAGDSVARREIDSRISSIQQALVDAIHLAFESATWFLKNHMPQNSLTRIELNRWISKCCGEWYKHSPNIQNELLNRRQASSSAIAAQNQLLRLMVLHTGHPTLQIEGFPAEAGLFNSILVRTNLYRDVRGVWKFANLTEKYDPANLLPAWNAAKELLQTRKGDAIGLDEIYCLWRQPPYGIADGLLSILAVAFLMSHSTSIAFYRDGLFRPELSDLDADYLAKDEKDIQLRWIDLTDNSKRLLAGLASLIQELRPSKALLNLKPIDVARELVAIHDGLPGWVKRTQRLSANTLQVRRLLNQARDPNEFLFRDLPSVLQRSSTDFENQNTDQLIEIIGSSLRELSAAYGDLIAKIKVLLLEELEVPNSSEQALEELRQRALNISGVAGDFLAEAFNKRISNFDGSQESIENIASMAVSKPLEAWVDQDAQKAIVEIAAFCRAFRRTESYAHVAGRKDKRQAMSVVVSIEGRQKELWEEFDVKESDRAAVDQITNQVRSVLEAANSKERNVVLAALAELSAEYLRNQKGAAEKKTPGKAA